MTPDVLAAKIETIRRCLARVEARTPAAADDLVDDVDAQDIICLNLERAVQACVDIAAHVLAASDQPVPATMAESFSAMRRAGAIDQHAAERMRKAVGFRNIAVHDYKALDWRIVYSICSEHLDDFRDYVRQVLSSQE